MRPTYAEVRPAALLANYRLLHACVQQHAGQSAGLIAVVKADAYGHGLAACGRSLAQAGATWLGVTSVEEGVALRHALGRLRARVLVMSGFFPGEEGGVLEHNLTPHVWEPYQVTLLEAAARRMGLGARTLPVHLEIDTGMSRQGVTPGDALAALLRAAGTGERDSPLFVEGALTHFSSPEQLNGDVMAEQTAQFRAALAQLQSAGVQPRWIHAGNSANAAAGVGLGALAALARDYGSVLLVRPGLALYGAPVQFAPAAPPGSAMKALQPVLTWKTEITSLRTVAPGAAVGYNETFRVDRPDTRLALVPVGYADGLSRLLSNRGAMLVRGRRAPIVGRISMDQTVLDVSEISEAALGDEVVILGAQGAQCIPAGEIAELCGTIPYEVLCGIGARVRRVLR